MRGLGSASPARGAVQERLAALAEAGEEARAAAGEDEDEDEDEAEEDDE